MKERVNGFRILNNDSQERITRTGDVVLTLMHNVPPNDFVVQKMDGVNPIRAVRSCPFCENCNRILCLRSARLATAMIGDLMFLTSFHPSPCVEDEWSTMNIVLTVANRYSASWISVEDLEQLARC